MQQALPGIHTWSVFDEERRLHFNGWHVSGPAGCVLVDPPPADGDDAAALAALPRPEAIVITNRNHVRAAPAHAARLGIPIVMHRADAATVEVEVGEAFEGGMTIEGGLVTVEVAASKSPGETALHLPWCHALLIGDALIGDPPGEVRLLPAAKIPDREAAREGIRALLALPFEALLLGDGTSLIEGGRAAIERFVAREEV